MVLLTTGSQELMNLKQLNDYLLNNNLSRRYIPRNYISNIIYCNKNSYFYILPNDIKYIIIDLSYPCKKIIPQRISNLFLTHFITSYSYFIEIDTAYIIKFKKLNKYCIYLPYLYHRKIILKDITTPIICYYDESINIYLNNFLHIYSEKSTYKNYKCINTNLGDLEFTKIYKNDYSLINYNGCI